MNVLPIIPRLPDRYLLLIGEAITAWALLEHELRLTTFLLLGLDNKRGRLAVRNTRAKDAVELIEDLMQQSHIRSSTTNLRSLAKVLDEAEGRRNTLAHNIWLRDPSGTPLIQSMTGSWPEKDGRKLKRRVVPAGIPITEHSLEDLAKAIRSCIAAVVSLRQELSDALRNRSATTPDPTE